MKIVRSLVIFGAISLSGYYGITHSVNPALAQIVPDHSLGDNPSVVKPNVEVKGLPADLIEGGATRGDNLFHSFSDFNVGDLQRVYFANPAGINNILGRVTGSNISKIFGTLGVDGAANLFLVNPNGIVFGANSQLDVAGSFVGSTANSIVFGNGIEFSAINPEEPPLLTINITPGLQYGKTGLQYGQNPPQPIVNAGNLAVGQGQNVTLVGGSVISTGDILAPGGEINILAVPPETLVQLGQVGEILTVSTPTVPLTPSDPASVTEFLSSLNHDTGVTVSSDGQLTLTDSGTIVPVAPGTVIISGALSAANLSPEQTGGKVTVLGDQVGLFEAQLNGGSNVTITAGTTGNQEGNITGDGFGITKTTEGEVTLSLQAANDISLKNVDINASSGLLNLFLEADSDNSGSGDVDLMNGGIDHGGINTGGGAVTITAAGAIALEGLKINSDTESQRNAGDITITAGSLLLEKDSDLDSNTKGKSTGNAGNITITVADSVVFRGDSGLGSSTQDHSTGNGGEITITATSVLFEDKGSGIGSNTEGDSSGNAGKITITADSVVFNNQSGIGTNTTGNSTGNGGEITITAGSVLFDDKGTGTGKDQVRTGLGSDTEGHSSGDAGKITITADSVVFRGNSGIGTNTQGKSSGNAGEVTITAGSLLLEDKGTGTGSDTRGHSSGDAGKITITADSVVFKGNSGFGTNTTDDSTGNAGEITITAGSVLFENDSGLGSNTQGKSTGDAGNITINADSLVLRGDSGIGTNTIGNSTGDAGIITINADSISLENLSKIESTTDTMGDAGEITINAESIVLENQARISNNTKENSTGDAGEIKINADSISLENNSNISSQTASGNGGNIMLTLQDLLILRNGSQISTSAGTEDQPGNGGDITITADFILAVLEENSDITANAFDGMGGNITLTGRGIFGFNFPDQPTNLSDITASSERGVDGNITINILDFNPSQGLVELPTTVVDASTLIAASCTDNVKVASDDSKGDEFIITGRGGLPPSPLEPIIRQTVIADWVTLDNSATANYQSQQTPVTPGAGEESARKGPRRRIVEAQGWLIGPDGTVILTAFPTTPEIWANSSLKSPSCEDLRRISNGS
ncbi:MAG: filamentous hemagglutinin N-terminal domain-containing protein [Moorea sp. SIO4A3]|nr:filamentous hemagglutinin N-terminal domain-containing protein [Moorena sp. SIO4A3]